MLGLACFVVAPPASAAEEVLLQGPAAAAAARARGNAASSKAASSTVTTPVVAAKPAAAAAPAAAELSGPAAAAQARVKAMRGGDPATTASVSAIKPITKPGRRKQAKKAPKNWKQALALLSAAQKQGDAPDPAASLADDAAAEPTGKSKQQKVGKAPKPLEPITDTWSIFGDSTAILDQPLTDQGLPVIAEANIEPQKTAIIKYTAIVAQGGWVAIPPLQMEVGTSHPAVGLLRKRLRAEGDLAEESSFNSEDYFGTDVEAAVRRFQVRNGLAQTGDLLDKDRAKNGSRTVTALNVPAASRLAQLKVNLGRIQSGVKWAGNRYVVANLPDQEIQAVENGRVVLRLAGVVGRPERPSPALTSNIYVVKFNPTWTMPPTVLKEDFLPKARELQAKNVNLLLKAGIDAYDGTGRKLDPTKVNFNSGTAANLRYTQQPSKDNPLGFAKLEFASPDAVYMHDTPSAKLFGKAYRAASSGCIRVENMEKLVRWLLKDTEGWSGQRVAQMKQTGETFEAKLSKGVPLQWVYITAWADANGVVNFRRDIYGRDQSAGVDKMAAAY